MARTTTIVSVSLPPRLTRQAWKKATLQHMTRSEYVRSVIRRDLEEADVEEAARVADEERRAGKLKVLKGSLSQLMRS